MPYTIQRANGAAPAGNQHLTNDRHFRDTVGRGINNSLWRTCLQKVIILKVLISPY